MENKRKWEKDDEEELPADFRNVSMPPIHIYMKSKSRHV